MTTVTVCDNIIMLISLTLLTITLTLITTQNTLVPLVRKAVV